MDKKCPECHKKVPEKKDTEKQENSYHETCDKCGCHWISYGPGDDSFQIIFHGNSKKGQELMNKQLSLV